MAESVKQNQSPKSEDGVSASPAKSSAMGSARESFSSAGGSDSEKGSNRNAAVSDSAGGEKKRSRFYAALANILYLFLLASLAVLALLTILTLDFIDVVQFRYKIPVHYRVKWPLSIYYNFVKFNQLPGDERLQTLILQKSQLYDEMMASGTDELKKRAEELEKSYRELVKAQEDDYRKRKNELLILQEEIDKEKKQLEETKLVISNKKNTIDVLSRQVASEAYNLETSLLRFMEEENRLKPVQEMAASMDPRSLGAILEEVPDNLLIYEVLKGVPPERSALVLSYMDPEKAGKIMKMSKNPTVLPGRGSNRSVVPPSLEDLLASSQANLQ